MPLDEAYELAYREAVRALDHQLATVTELRSRAGMLLATASIAVSLRGHETASGLDPITGLAVACFGMLSVCVLVIVWPHAGWSFALDAQTVLGVHLAMGASDATALSSDLIAHIAEHCRVNGHQLARMSRAFRIGACLLAIQIVLTVVAASTTI